MPYSNGSGQYPRTPKVIPLYASGCTKPVAFVNVVKRLLYKTVDGQRHFVKIPPGIAFDDGVWQAASDYGAAEIEVTDGSAGNVYTTTLATFLKHAEVVNRGFGRQLVLRFTYWRKNGEPSEVERLTEVQAARAETSLMQQLSLFGGGR
jgi:hypothetical protein